MSVCGCSCLSCSCCGLIRLLTNSWTNWLNVQRKQYPHTLKKRIEKLNSYNCFFFAFSLSVSVSTDSKTKNMSNTYWQTSLDGLSAQEFRLFLHCGRLRGIHIHTLRWKEKDHRILPHITAWVNCSTFLIAISLFSFDRYPPPHTEMQRQRPPHIVTYGLICSMLNRYRCFWIEFR